MLVAPTTMTLVTLDVATVVKRGTTVTGVAMVDQSGAGTAMVSATKRKPVGTNSV